MNHVIDTDNLFSVCIIYLPCNSQLTHLAIWGSIASWFLFLLVYSHIYMIVDLAPEMLGMVCTCCRVLSEIYRQLCNSNIVNKLFKQHSNEKHFYSPLLFVIFRTLYTDVPFSGWVLLLFPLSASLGMSHGKRKLSSFFNIA